MEIKEQTFMKYIGESENGIEKNMNVFIELVSQKEKMAWVINKWKTLTRVSFEDLAEPTEVTGMPKAEPERIVVDSPYGASHWHVPKNGKGLQFGKLKEPPKATEEEIDEAIRNNEIYRRVRSEINKDQRNQIAYGLGKYPETLNEDTWNILETIAHIKGELMDALQYLTMLQIKYEKAGDKNELQ